MDLYNSTRSRTRASRKANRSSNCRYLAKSVRSLSSMVFQMADLRVSRSEVFPRKFMVAQHNAAQHRMCRQVVLCVKGAAVHLLPGLCSTCIQGKWLTRRGYESSSSYAFLHSNWKMNDFKINEACGTRCASGACRFVIDNDSACDWPGIQPI